MELKIFAFEDQSGRKNIDNNLLDYLNNEISSKNKTDLSNYLGSINIFDNSPEIADATTITGHFEPERPFHYGEEEIADSFESGRSIFGHIKTIFAKRAFQMSDEIAAKIANSYIIDKLKIYKLRRDYNKLIREENRDDEEK